MTPQSLRTTATEYNKTAELSSRQKVCDYLTYILKKFILPITPVITLN